MNLFLLVKSGQIFPPNKKPTTTGLQLYGADATRGGPPAGRTAAGG